MRPELVDATLDRRRHDEGDVAPDSTTTFDDEEDDIANSTNNEQLLPMNSVDEKLEKFQREQQSSSPDTVFSFMPLAVPKLSTYPTTNMFSRNLQNNLLVHTLPIKTEARFVEPVAGPSTKSTEAIHFNRSSKYRSKEDENVKEVKVEIQMPASKISHRVSVIKKTPLTVKPDSFNSSLPSHDVPFKKREDIKDWIPYCQKLSLDGSPTIHLTTEESCFIEKRVFETRQLVLYLHESCHELSKDWSTNGLNRETDHCVEVFRTKAIDIFGTLSDGTKNEKVADMYKSNLMKERFLTCCMTAIAVRLYGGPDVDCFPHTHSFYQKYDFLLRSPWASALEDEVMVERTLREVGEIIGADKRMEVLYTSAIMRGFR